MHLRSLQRRCFRETPRSGSRRSSYLCCPRLPSPLWWSHYQRYLWVCPAGWSTTYPLYCFYNPAYQETDRYTCEASRNRWRQFDRNSSGNRRRWSHHLCRPCLPSSLRCDHYWWCLYLHTLRSPATNTNANPRQTLWDRLRRLRDPLRIRIHRKTVWRILQMRPPQQGRCVHQSHHGARKSRQLFRSYLPPSLFLRSRWKRWMQLRSGYQVCSSYCLSGQKGRLASRVILIPSVKLSISKLSSKRLTGLWDQLIWFH